ncbi:MAG: acyl--CoA ligase [Solobacterium sp.]|nr:acyl--CoA ligase [Solobacterium sp.]
METAKLKKHIVYPERTMFQMVKQAAEKAPDYPAYEFFGKRTTYRQFILKIERTARAFTAMGIRRGDAVTICMPNTPQALDCFYGLNRIGAICNMVHPQSAQKEITFFLDFSKSRMILTLDLFYEKVAAAVQECSFPVTILTARMQDELDFFRGTVFSLTKGKAFRRYPDTPEGMLWTQFLRKGQPSVKLPEPVYDPSATAAILYSGGTSSTPKGICLSDRNFNATALQATEAILQPLGPGDTMLSCMPVFHGFGLGINIHTILINGAECILMPTFSGKSYAEILKKKKPNYIAGVPTIFEALLHIKELNNADLSCLKGMFCGGDALSVELKKKVDAFLKAHNASIQVREGYGLTECVTASCLTPRDTYREHSIGLPFPDTEYCIVRPGTDEELPAGEEGEIILKGPSVMLGYLKNPKETAKALRKLEDGDIWLFTGDLGHMDEDGYIYFHQRIKRMIITNGYNVYPGQIENIIDSCEEVAYSCVIGVKDPHRMQSVRAYVVLKPGYEGDEQMKERIRSVLFMHVSAYAMPREIVFRAELPKTLVGKVAYRKLEEEANAETDSSAGSV